MDNQLLRHSAKEHFFRAVLCRMCQDMQDGTNALSKYEEMFPAFSDSRECKLLKVCDEQNSILLTPLQVHSFSTPSKTSIGTCSASFVCYWRTSCNATLS